MLLNCTSKQSHGICDLLLETLWADGHLPFKKMHALHQLSSVWLHARNWMWKEVLQRPLSLRFEIALLEKSELRTHNTIPTEYLFHLFAEIKKGNLDVEKRWKKKHNTNRRGGIKGADHLCCSHLIGRIYFFYIFETIVEASPPGCGLTWTLAKRRPWFHVRWHIPDDVFMRIP